MAGAFITITPSGHEPVLELMQQLYAETGDLSPVLGLPHARVRGCRNRGIDRVYEDIPACVWDTSWSY